MKAWINRWIYPLVTAGLGVVSMEPARGQVFTTLYTFTARINYTNGDGALPTAGVVSSGGMLYGTAQYGGTNDGGTVFALGSSGSGFADLYDFTAMSGAGSSNNDGTLPYANLITVSGTLYGTAQYGGTAGKGSVFRVNTDGTGFTNLHNFTATAGLANSNSDGATPFAGLVLLSNTLYGTASSGGTTGKGVVFAMNTDGTGFTNLHSFVGTSDGEFPIASLVVLSNRLYGAASFGGLYGNGTVFALNSDGTAFTNLHNFTSLSALYYEGGTNSDGVLPLGALAAGEGVLYGTTEYGGTNGAGTVFKLNSDGSGFATLYSFTSNGTAINPQTNSDGGNPAAALVLSGNTLHGTAYYGGCEGYGTVFALNTDGSAFTNLHSFTGGSDGAYPNGGLAVAGYALYGTTLQGGVASTYNGNGTVFGISFAPQLTATLAGTNLVLTWPAAAEGFDYTGLVLQTTAALGAAASWSQVSPPQTVANGQCAVTNGAIGAQGYYRLAH